MSIYPELTAVDNMKMQCIITRTDYSQIDELLGFVGLSNTKKKKANDFSLGMRQRLGIAMALINNPRLMLLDEPINGLDPEGIHQIRELLLKMHEEKKSTDARDNQGIECEANRTLSVLWCYMEFPKDNNIFT